MAMAMEEEENMMYEIIDVEGGFVYEVVIPKSMEAVYNMDHVERHRLLKSMKERNVKPVSSWDVSLAAQGRIDENAGSMSMWQPEPPKKPVGGRKIAPKNPSQPVTASGRATGKKGAKWGEKNTNSMLNCCLPYRKWLRVDTVISEITWQKISDNMFELDPPLDYSWEQIRERIRNLKQSFKKAKAGLLGGTQWDHYWLMFYIYDEKIEPGNVTLAPQSVAESDEEPKVAERPASDLVLLNIADEDFMHESGIAELSIQQSKPVSPVFFPSHFLSSTMISGDDHHETGNAGSEAITEGHEVNAVAADHNPSVGPSWVVLSPSKKKSKNIESQARERMLSPTVKKTTPRKVPKAKLVWPIEVTEAFVKQCVIKKAELRVERIPLKTWKDIEGVLNIKEVTWQTCRDKYDVMRQLFVDTMLPLEGVMAGVKWPYYDEFCTIFDIPHNAHKLMDCSEKPQPENSGLQKRKWDEGATKLLIDCYKRKQPEFESNKIALRHNFLFSQIAEEIKKSGYTCDYKKCKLEWAGLLDRLRQEHDSTKGTGSSPSTWPYFQDMMEIFHKSATLEPPFGVSVGTGGLKYSKSGEECSSRSNASRSRPSTSSKASSAASRSQEEGVQKGSKKQVFKSWAQEAKERELEQRTDVITEFRLMRQFFEKRDAKRDAQWDSMTEAIKYSSGQKQ